MINFSGLASGLDSASIIDQIVAAETAQATSLQIRQAGLNAQKTKVGELSGLLKSLETAAEEIDTIGELRAAKGESSNEDRVAVAVSSLAQPGIYAMRVTGLAAAQSNVSATFADPAAAFGSAGSLDITVGGDAAVNIAWADTESLADVAGAINASEARVNATVLFDGTDYRLMVTAEETGTDNAVTFAETGPGVLSLNGVGNQLVAATDAQFSLNGLAMTSGTNVVSDSLTGVTFTLATTHDVGEPDTTVEVARDPEAQREVVGKFVDAFNEIADFLENELGYTGTTKGSDSLFGDSTIRSLLSNLRSS